MKAQRQHTNVEMNKHTLKIKREYEHHLLKHDLNSPEAAHWVGKDKAWLRTRILTEIGEVAGKKVLDFGCGNGLLLDFLKENRVSCDYYGWDISEKMIEIARRRHPLASFAVVDVLKNELKNFTSFFDYVLISGVFHIKKDTEAEIHRRWSEEILLRLWPLCREGMAFNLMTEYVDWKDGDLYYCPMSEMVDFCVSNLSRWLVVRQDYQLWEYTVYVYKAPRVIL